jgi:Amt family ammonium transporter
VTAYSFIATAVIYKLIDMIIGLRVNDHEEAVGLDITQHDERGYTIIE